MAKFRMIHTEFWSDVKVVEEMTPEDKYFFLYLLTNSNTTQVGIYQITKKQMAFDTGYSPESVNALLDRFINYHKILKYNPETREIAIKNWGKYNLNRGGKPMQDCVKSELKQVKDQSLINFVGERIEKSDIKALYDTYNDTSTIRGQEKEEEEEQEEEKEQQQEEEKPASRSSNVFEFFQQNFGALSPYVAEDIGKWVDDLSEELVIKAMVIALELQKPWKYSKSILKNWSDKNVKTLDDVAALEVEYKRQQENKSYSKKAKEVVPEWFKDRQAKPSQKDTDQKEQPDVADLLKNYKKGKQLS